MFTASYKTRFFCTQLHVAFVVKTLLIKVKCPEGIESSLETQQKLFCMQMNFKCSLKGGYNHEMQE